jgi:hypothetical protein
VGAAAIVIVVIVISFYFSGDSLNERFIRLLRWTNGKVLLLWHPSIG